MHDPSIWNLNADVVKIYRRRMVDIHEKSLKNSELKEANDGTISILD